MRTRLLATALCATALLVPAVPAAAAGNGTVHTGGCAASRTLASVDEVIDSQVDWRPYSDADRADGEALIRATDLNGDGLLCYKAYQQSSGRDKQWGVPDYRLLQIGDDTSPGR
jgi:hypothetical protein